MMPPAGSKSVSELAEIAQQAGVPFIVKGIMTAKAALKAQQAGAHAIIVSNHGGRVLDQCAATAEVLPEIAAAVDGRCVLLLTAAFAVVLIFLKRWPWELMLLLLPVLCYCCFWRRERGCQSIYRKTGC